MVFYFLLLLAAVSVDGQLQFVASQRGHHVNVNCTLKDIHTTNLQLLISMSVARVTNNQEEILASATSVGSRPVAHSGVVTSSISIDGSHESYVNIEWSFANSSLEGNYVCRINGLDNDNSPAILSETLTFTLKDRGPGVKATPDALEVGFTETLSIRCFVSDLVTLNVSEVTSIDLSHIYSGIDQLLATITVVAGIETKPGSEVVAVDGYLGNGEDDENFLEATWQDPGQNKTGSYQCIFNGIDVAGNPVHFESTTDLRLFEPSRESLVKQLRELQDNYDKLSKEKQDLSAEKDNAALRIRVLEESLKGHKICDSVNLPLGQYPITLFPDDGLGLLNVLCDVVGPGDVWTVFQKRYNGAENFTRGFAAYSDGFGSVHAEHWLGLKTMKRIMTSGSYTIRVDITDHSGINYTRIYPTFDLGPAEGYTLSVNGYNDGGHGLSFSSGSDFSTHDHGPQPHCAIQDYGGWWYDNCAFTNLNGQWGHAGEAGVSWYEIPEGRSQPLKYTEMKFKKTTLP